MKAKWDALQSGLHCCGGSTSGSFQVGYNDWIGKLNDGAVPDSCCHEVEEGCGNGIFQDSNESIRSKIFVHGCLAILRPMLEKDVVPMMIVYACIGVLLAILELIRYGFTQNIVNNNIFWSQVF